MEEGLRRLQWGGDGGRVKKIKKVNIPLVIRTGVIISHFLKNINHSISKFAVTKF